MTKQGTQGDKRKRGAFHMKGHRTKKIASMNMRKEEHQFCIDAYLVPDVVKEIPDGIDIIQARISVWARQPNKYIVVPTNLKKLGISRIRQLSESNEFTFMFDEVSKSALEKKVKEGCKAMNVPYEQAYFNYVVLRNADGTGRFQHTTKEVTPDETDLRKKLRVLGLVQGEGQVQKLVHAIGAEKFYCTIKEEPVKFIMCSRE